MWACYALDTVLAVGGVLAGRRKWKCRVPRNRAAAGGVVVVGGPPEKTWPLPRLRVHAQLLPQAVHPHRQGYSSTCSCGSNARCQACGSVAQSSLTTRTRRVMCWRLLVAS